MSEHVRAEFVGYLDVSDRVITALKCLYICSLIFYHVYFSLMC